MDLDSDRGFRNRLVAPKELDFPCLTWFFVNPADFSDPPKEADKYQCLAIKDPSYLADYVEEYHCFSSYESDQEYLKLFDLLIDHLKCDGVYDDLAKVEMTAQSLAMQFHNLSPKLIPICAMDAMSLLSTIEYRKTASGRLFRVWKGVVKQKWNTEACLQSEYYSPNEYSMVKNQCGDLLEKIFQIEDMTTDDDALKLINDLLFKDIDPREGLYSDFIHMKASIAEELGIIPCQNSVIGCSMRDACLNGGAEDQWDAKLNERVQALQLDIQALPMQVMGEEVVIAGVEGKY